MKTIKDLVSSTDKRVYVYLKDEATARQFIADAELQGYHFADGVGVSRRKTDNYYAINRDMTVNFIGLVGRMAFHSKDPQLLRVDYAKYRNGEYDYVIENQLLL